MQGFNNTGVISLGPARLSNLSYIYRPREDNHNAISLQSLSRSLLDSNDNDDCTNCLFDPFVHYRDYYQKADYADHFVQAAMQGLQTNYYRGNHDFSSNNLLMARAGTSEWQEELFSFVALAAANPNG